MVDSEVWWIRAHHKLCTIALGLLCPPSAMAYDICHQGKPELSVTRKLAVDTDPNMYLHVAHTLQVL